MCQVKPIGSSWIVIIWSCWKKKQKLSAHENNCLKSPERDKIPIPIEVDKKTNYLGLSNFFRIFGVTEVFETSKFLQAVLFLTDSVFHVLFAYFDESMASNGAYEP